MFIQQDHKFWWIILVSTNRSSRHQSVPIIDSGLILQESSWTNIFDADYQVRRINHSILGNCEYHHSLWESIIQHSIFYPLFCLDLKFQGWYRTPHRLELWYRNICTLKFEGICLAAYLQVYAKWSKKIICRNSKSVVQILDLYTFHSRFCFSATFQTTLSKWKWSISRIWNRLFVCKLQRTHVFQSFSAL